MAGGDGFKIDTAGVGEFSAKLQSEVDKDLVPRSDLIKQRLLWNPAFGERSGSPAVQAAATAYYEQMRAAVSFLDTLIHNASSFAVAANDAVAAYKAGDDVSALTMTQILGSASTKSRETELAEATAADEARRSERQSMADRHRGTRR